MTEPVYPLLIPKADLDWKEHRHWSGLWNERLCQSIEQQMLKDQQAWSDSEPSPRHPPIPEVVHLYKYRTFDTAHPGRTFDILTQGKLWSPSLASLNDPLEGGFRASPEDAEANAAFSFVYMMRSPWCGCLSFSLDPVCNLMWSHYSGDHTGFCIQYRRDDSYLLSGPDCRPVRYRSSVPNVKLASASTLGSIVDLIFWTKSEAWEYEREWRLRYPRTDAYTFPSLLMPEGVIFGLKTPPDVMKLIKKEAPALRFGRVEPSGADYRLKIAWEKEEACRMERPSGKPSLPLSKEFMGLLDMAIEVAKMQLDEYGEFNPFGLAVYGGKANFIIMDPAAYAGWTGNQLIRRVEDQLRALREKETLLYAGIIQDSNVRPVEGGDVRSAITGRLEERGGASVTFMQDYKLVSGSARLGERVITPRDHHLLPDPSP